MSVPTGAVDAAHDPVPADMVAVHNVVSPFGPVVKVTEPVGVPGPVTGATVAA